MAGRLTDDMVVARHPNGPTTLAGHYVFCPNDFREAGLAPGFPAIRGVTTFDGVPGRAHVYLLDRATLQVVRDVRSGLDGVYEMPNILAGKLYLVLALDETNQDNAVVRDRVSSGGP